MPDPQDIIQRIALSGQDDVIEGLGDVGKAGEEAFKRLGDSVGEFGRAITALPVAIAGIGAGLFEWSKHSAESVVSLQALANELGNTVSGASALTGALASMGASTENIGFAFRHLGQESARAWDEIKKQSQTARDEQVDDALSVQKAQQSLFDARQKYADKEAKLGQPTGIVKPTQIEELQHQRAAALTEYQEAQQKATEAQEKADRDRLNSLQAIGPAVQSVIKGEKTLQEAGKDATLSVDNIIKGLTLSSAPGALEAIKNIGTSFSELQKTSPDVRKAFDNLADFLHNAKNAATESALEFRLFGRGVSQDMVVPLKEGSAVIKQYEEQAKSLGLVITDQDLKPAEDFHRAYNALASDLTTTFTQIGLGFAPAFTDALKEVQSGIENSHGSLLQFGKDAAATVAPAIKKVADVLVALVDAIGGKKGDENTQIGQWTTSFEKFGSEVKATAGEAVAAWNAFWSILKGIEATFKTIGEYAGKIAQASPLAGTTGKPGAARQLYNSVIPGGEQQSQAEADASILGGVATGLGITALLKRIIGGGGGAVARGAAPIAKGAATALPEAAAFAAPGTGAAEIIATTSGAIVAGLSSPVFIAAVGVALAAAFGKAAEFGLSSAYDRLKAGRVGEAERSFLEGGVGLNLDQNRAAQEHAATTDRDTQAVQAHADATKEATAAQNAASTVKPPTAPGFHTLGDNLPPNFKTVGTGLPPQFKEASTGLTPVVPPTLLAEGGVDKNVLPLSFRAPANVPLPAPRPQAADNAENQATQKAAQASDKLATSNDHAAQSVSNLAQKFDQESADIAQATQSSGVQNLQRFVDDVGSAIERLVGIIASVQNPSGGGSGGGNWRGGLMSFAGGGPAHLSDKGIVRGPGTGTSDSVLGRFSDGEWVVRADGSNLGDAINHFAGFAMGGLVNMFDLPKFASGGSMQVRPSSTGTSGRPLVLQFPGGHEFAGTVNEETADRLTRYATTAAIRRGNKRQPSWVSG